MLNKKIIFSLKNEKQHIHEGVYFEIKFFNNKYYLFYACKNKLKLNISNDLKFDNKQSIIVLTGVPGYVFTIIQDNNIHIIEIEFVAADGIMHAKYAKKYDLIENYIKCQLDKKINLPTESFGSSIVFSNIINCVDIELPDDIFYTKEKINPYKIEINNKKILIDTIHIYYSMDHSKLISFINFNYPYLSFQRN